MKNLIKLATFSLLLSIFTSCSWKDVAHRNEIKEGHINLYSSPDEKVSKVPAGFKRIVLIATNDILGNFSTRFETVKELNSNEEVEFSVGGIQGIAAYLNVFKKHYPGEIFQIDAGNALGKKADHLQQIFYMNFLGYDALTIGARDFNLVTESNYQNYLKNLVYSSKVPFVFSNLFDLKTVDSAKWQNLNTRYIKVVNGIKVGLIHILDPSNVSKIPVNRISGYYLQEPLEVIIKQSSALRREGAEVIILSINSKIDCTAIPMHELKLPKGKTNFHHTKHQCYEKDSLPLLLKQVPPGTIDAVVSSGSDTKVNNFIHGFPVIQTFPGGDALNWMELFVNKRHRVVDDGLTKIHSPLRLCHSMIKETQDCYTKENLSNIVQTPAKFQGKIIEVERQRVIRK